MSKGKPRPQTDEEVHRASHSHWVESSETLLSAASELGATLGLKSVAIASESPVAKARLTNGSVTVDFLYGPPEFHVEIFLSHARFPNRRLGLDRLVGHPPVLAWMTARRPQVPLTIGSAMAYYGDFLRDPCSDLFNAPARFFAAF